MSVLEHPDIVRISAALANRTPTLFHDSAMRRAAVLSPRGGPVEMPDLASRGRLIARQRISSDRLWRRVARRARWIAGRIMLLLSGAAVVAAAGLGGAWIAGSF